MQLKQSVGSCHYASIAENPHLTWLTSQHSRCERWLKESCFDRYESLDCKAADAFCEQELLATYPWGSSSGAIFGAWVLILHRRESI